MQGCGLEREREEVFFRGADVSGELKDIARALRSCERLYLALFLDGATSFRRVAVVCAVPAVIGVKPCLYTLVSTGCVRCWLLHMPTWVYKCYFCAVYFRNSSLCISAPTFKYCMLFSSLWFQTLSSRENYSAILRETVSLPGFGNDVMSADPQKARQMCYSKTFFIDIGVCKLGSTWSQVCTPSYNLGGDQTSCITDLKAHWSRFTESTVSPNIVNIHLICLSLSLIVFFATAALPFIIMTIVSKPYQRGVYCEDESIRYPLKPDTITHGMLAAVTISCTVIIVSSPTASISPFFSQAALLRIAEVMAKIMESLQDFTHLTTSCAVCSITE